MRLLPRILARLLRFEKQGNYPSHIELIESGYANAQRILSRLVRPSDYTVGQGRAWPSLKMIWRARRELNPGPPGLLHTGKSFTERVSPVLYLTELRALPLIKTIEFEKGFAV